MRCAFIKNIARQHGGAIVFEGAYHDIVPMMLKLTSSCIKVLCPQAHIKPFYCTNKKASFSREKGERQVTIAACVRRSIYSVCDIGSATSKLIIRNSFFDGNALIALREDVYATVVVYTGSAGIGTHVQPLWRLDNGTTYGNRTYHVQTKYSGALGSR